MQHRVPANLRERAVAAVLGGPQRAEVARAFGFAPRTLERWLATQRCGEPLAYRPRAGRPPKIAPSAHAALVAQVAAHPDATLAAHCQRGAQEHGVQNSPTTMGRDLAKLGWPLKNSPRSLASATRPSEPSGGSRWPGFLPPICSFWTRPAPRSRSRRCARAPRGQRAIGRLPQGTRPHIAWLATLSAAGMGESLVIDGPVDGRVFIAFVERALVPSLRPGQIVVLNNLSVHKSARACAAIAAAGCQLVFLPPYSPDFNPIEQAFAKTKQALRCLEARSWESIVTAIGQVVNTITPADADGSFTAAGFTTSWHNVRHAL